MSSVSTMLKNLNAIQTETGAANSKKHLSLMAAVGVTDGLAILTLLPITQQLSEAKVPTVPLIILLVLTLVGFGLRYVTTLLGYSVALDFLRSAHQIVGDKLATLPLGWFRPSRTGGLSSLVSDKFMQATELFAHQLGILVRELAVLVTLTIGAFFWNPWLGLIFIVLGPIVIAVMTGANALKKSAANRALPASKELSSRILEYARNQSTLRAAGRNKEFEPLADALDADFRARRRELWVATGALVLTGLSTQIFVVAIIVLTAWLAADQSLHPLVALAIVGIALRFSKILDNLGEAFVGLDGGRLTLDEISTITTAASLPEPANPQTGDNSGSVELDHVSFGYHTDSGDHTPVLSDVSFSVAPHTVTAIVGPSGSGKTTISRLISRFFDVDSGTIRVDGVDIREMGTEELMSRLSMVFQDVYLFDDTLYNNVVVGKPTATREEVLRVADLAGVTEIADRLSWDADVGESGGLLSGGERQRVSIARALLKDAPIVLFDEATSALDAENEANILASMEALRQHSTFIVVAHKLDTVRGADQIVVLSDEGTISEIGTHEELYAAGGDYRRFWERRSQAAGWSISA